MSSYLFVHGMFGGAWCWERVLALLREKGHIAQAIDLPAHGRDRLPASDVRMRDYVDRICNAVTASPKPVVLVSHGASGIWASQAAEFVPERIFALIYVAAIIPRDGESLADWGAHAPDSLTVPNTRLDPQTRTVFLEEAIARAAFFADCSAEDTSDALRRMRPSPAVPLIERVSLSVQRFGSVPRRYVICERDRSMPFETQRLICETSPCEAIMRLDTGHAAYYAAPAKLAVQLLLLGQNAFVRRPYSSR